MSKYRELLLGTAARHARGPAASPNPSGSGARRCPRRSPPGTSTSCPTARPAPGGMGVEDGEQAFIDNCAACHGDFAEGLDNWPPLAGGRGTLTDDRPVKTVGSYWPYLSTVWDYVNRSMPYGNAQSLTRRGLRDHRLHPLFRGARGLRLRSFERELHRGAAAERGRLLRGRPGRDGVSALHRRALHDRLQGRGGRSRARCRGSQRDADRTTRASPSARSPTSSSPPPVAVPAVAAGRGGARADARRRARTRSRACRAGRTRLPRLPDLPRGGRRARGTRPARI
jgi:hypothetical protein